MGISSVNNNQMAFTGTVNKNTGTVNKNMGNGEVKKPSKAKIAAGAAVVAGTVVLGAGLASGKVKPADIQAFIQNAKIRLGICNNILRPCADLPCERALAGKRRLQIRQIRRCQKLLVH